MAEQLNRVLVVSRQASRSETIARALAKRGLEMVAFESSQDAVGALPQTEAAAALIEVAGDDPSLLALVEAIRSSSGHAAIPVVLVAADPESELVAQARAAGASEVLPRSSSTQTVAETLKAQVEGAALAAAPATSSGPEEPTAALAVAPSGPGTGSGPNAGRRGSGELWVVCGPRGGVGRTAIATNLAVLAASRLKVALVDNVPRFGSVLLAFNLPPQTPTWVELSELPEEEELLDRLTRHPSGVAVLPAPTRPELADAVSPAAVGALIYRLTRSADLVVVDQGGRLDNGGIDILESADHMILVGTPDTPGVLGVHYWLRICDQLGIPRERISVVLNCVLPYHQMDTDRAQKVLQHPVLTLAHGGIDGVRSLSGGEPLAWKHASSRWAKQLRTLATQISPGLGEKLKH